MRETVLEISLSLDDWLVVAESCACESVTATQANAKATTAKRIFMVLGFKESIMNSCWLFIRQLSLRILTYYPVRES